MAYAYVEVDMDDLETSDLINELEARGYVVDDDRHHVLNKFDIEYLLNLLDNTPQDWYSSDIKQKIKSLR